MSGPDVDQLVALLITHNYLSKNQSGYKSYFPPVKSAVITFQRDAGIPVTGVCNFETIKTLQTWGSIKAKKKANRKISKNQTSASRVGSQNPLTPDKTVYKLGERPLSMGDTGPDVYKLIFLLKKNNFLSINSMSVSFDSNVRDAVKKCQGQFRIAPTGVADLITINALLNLEGK